MATAAARLVDSLLLGAAEKEQAEDQKEPLYYWRSPKNGSLFSFGGVREGMVVTAWLVSVGLGFALVGPVTATLAVTAVLLEAIALLANRPRIAAFSGGAIGALAGALAGPTVGLPPVAALVIGAAACTATITGAVGAYRVFLAPAPNHA